MNKKQLLLDLYNAKSSEDVYNTVVRYGLDGEEYWKPYGGDENNARTFENQQSSPENALVEKLTNSIDAILMKECYIRNIDPKDKTNPELPRDMYTAVEKFFGVENGKWENVLESKRNEVAQNIQIIVSDDKKTPNVAIYDNGEGQNPSCFPETFLSISRGNKNNVPFVQGKYNMGSTGAVVFCGEKYRYQMIISRRNSELCNGDGYIGFTLVRRHILSKDEEQNVKLTWYEYLVIDGEIPSIKAEPLDLGLHEDKGHNKVLFESGSIVKMYSYQLTNPSIATLDLWRKLNTLLYVSALPILIYEKRNFRMNSPAKQMLGNRTRLALDGRNKVAFSKDFSIGLFDCDIPIKVYIFTRDTDNDEFIDEKSVIYTLNGQTQGAEGKNFIVNKKGLNFRNLKEYMLVSVDCSQLTASYRQDLFMASRDRLKEGEYYKQLRGAIINLLKQDPDIIRMDQEYKGKEFRETGEDRDLVQSFFSRLKSNSDIKKILSGKNGAFPIFTKKVKKPVDRPDSKKKEEKKKLQRYPSIFRVQGFEKDTKDYVKAIRRGSRGRITIETDVENDFLSRSEYNGSLVITTLDYGHHGGSGGGQRLPSEEHKKLRVQTSGPYDGEIQVFIEPTEDAEVGDTIPLSIKMISPDGDHEVIVFVKIEKEAEPSKEPKKKTVEEPDFSLPDLVRVVKESPNSDEATWDDYKMTAENVVKLSIDSEGAVDKIMINMDSNLVKKLVNTKDAKADIVSKKYLTSVYSHALMLYTTMHDYLSMDDTEGKKYGVDDVDDKLKEAVEYSFNAYASFLMAYEDIKDKDD